MPVSFYGPGSVRNNALPTTILQPRIQFQDYQFQVRLPAGVWRWTTRADVSKATTTFEVRDIVSPYGLLRDSIPIPGDVITEMANSITEIQQQFTPSILLAPTTLVFTIDEGRGASTPQTVLVTNAGSFGSLLSASVVSSAPYVYPTPANVSGLAFNESGQFGATADSTNLLATGSPYSADLTVQDPNATNSPQVIPVTINVRSKAEIDTDTALLEFNAIKPITGAFPPVPSQSFQLSNTGLGDSVLEWQIQKVSGVNWIASVNPIYGLLPGGQAQTVTVAVYPAAGSLAGTFSETLRITGYSSNLQLDVEITLTIT